MRNYYRRFLRQFWTDLWHWGRTEVLVGILIAVSTLLFQVRRGLVPAQLTLDNAAALLEPYMWLSIAVVIWTTLRTPYKIDEQKQWEINGLRAESEQYRLMLERDPAEEALERDVANRLGRMSSVGREVLRFVYHHGDLLPEEMSTELPHISVEQIRDALREAIALRLAATSGRRTADGMVVGRCYVNGNLKHQLGRLLFREV